MALRANSTGAAFLRLVIARLDRLARNAALIAGLMESGVDFVAADMPLANRFTLHILAAVAEYESRLMSQRINAAPAIRKAKGDKRGAARGRDLTPYHDRARRTANALRLRRALARAADMAPILRRLRDQGETVTGVAIELTAMGIPPPGGGARWYPKTVLRMFNYAGERPRSCYSSSGGSKNTLKSVVSGSRRAMNRPSTFASGNRRESARRAAT